MVHNTLRRHCTQGLLSKSNCIAAVPLRPDVAEHAVVAVCTPLSSERTSLHIHDGFNSQQEKVT